MTNGGSVPAYELLWAKQANGNGYIEKSLLSHMMETAWICISLLNDTSMAAYRRWLSDVMGAGEEDCVRTAAFIVGMHDIGKCHPLFQMRYKESENIRRLHADGYFRSPSDYSEAGSLSFRHEYYGGDVLRSLLKGDGWDSDTAEIIQKVTHMHHQKKRDYRGYLPKNDAALWTGMQEALYARMKEELRPSGFVLREGDMDTFFIFMNGIGMYSDWIASGETFRDTDIRSYASMEEYKKDIKDRMDRYIKRYRLSVCCPDGKCGKDMGDILPMTRGWRLHPIQKLAENIMKGMGGAFDCVIVEAEMGCGKTEIAEYMALYLMRQGLTDKKGVYIGLPTEATSEVMQPRLVHMLRDAGCIEPDGGVPLFTGHAFIREYMKQYNMDNVDGSGGDVKPQLPSSLKFLHPWAVGTVDQSMKFFLMVKHGALGVSGINSKILIIDEMHAYDAYMFKILETELRWAKAFGTPVIILSATLSEALKKKIFDIYVDGDYALCGGYPLISVCRGGQLEQYPVEKGAGVKVYRIRTEKWLNDPSKIAAHAVSRIKDGGCLAIIMNTVKSAGDVYEEVLRAADGDTTVILFHGRMPSGPKARMTDKIVRLFGKDRSVRPRKAIVVATQIIEQSIDVDFDYMMTAICPADLLFQRIGRERRHDDAGTVRAGRKWDTECLVLYGTNKCDDVYPYIDNSILLKRTLSLIKRHRTVRVPSDIRHMINEVYRDGDDMAAYMASNAGKAHHAVSHTIGNPGKYGDLFLYENRGRCGGFHEATRSSDIQRADVAFVGQEDFNTATDKGMSLRDFIRIRTEHTVPVPVYTLNKMGIKEGTDGICAEGASWMGGTIIYNTDRGRFYLDGNYFIREKQPSR